MAEGTLYVDPSMTAASWGIPGDWEVKSVAEKHLTAQESRFPASHEATDKQEGGASATADGTALLIPAKAPARLLVAQIFKDSFCTFLMIYLVVSIERCIFAAWNGQKT